MVVRGVHAYLLVIPEQPGRLCSVHELVLRSNSSVAP